VFFVVNECNLDDFVDCLFVPQRCVVFFMFPFCCSQDEIVFFVMNKCNWDDFVEPEMPHESQSSLCSLLDSTGFGDLFGASHPPLVH